MCYTWWFQDGPTRRHRGCFCPSPGWAVPVADGAPGVAGLSLLALVGGHAGPAWASQPAWLGRCRLPAWSAPAVRPSFIFMST